MSMQYDVKASTVTATGSVYSQRTRVKAITITTTGVAGSVVLKDGGASGTSLITLNTPAQAEMFNILIPGEGVLFSTDVHATLADVTSITVFYG